MDVSMKDAYDLGYEILNMWRERSIAHQNSGMMSKTKIEVPCYIISEHGIDPVKGIYFDKDFGLMIDGRLK
jgi:hypothetical protein